MNTVKHTLTAILFILATLMLGQTTASAQVTQPNQSPTDTLAFGILPSLSHDFYNTSSIVDRNYNYELLNKKRSLQMWSGEVLTIGMIIFMGEIAANSVLAVNNKWNLWIDIPCATIVGMATLMPFVFWSKHLQQRADAIEISPTIGYFNNGTMPFTALNPNPANPSSLAIGINIKANF